METTQPAPPAPKGRRWPKRFTLGVSPIAALGVGVGISSATRSADVSQATYNASQARVSAPRRFPKCHA